MARVRPPISPPGPGLNPAGQRPEALPLHCLLPGLANLRHQWLGDPESVYQQLARVAPMRDFRSLVPDSHFYQWAGLLDLGEVVLASYAGSNACCAVDDAPAVHLMACFAGYLTVTTPTGEVHGSAGGLMLLPVGQREAWGSQSAAIVTIQPQHIARVAIAMAGGPSGLLASPRRSAVFAPLQISPGPQAEAVHGLLRSIDATAAIDPQLPARLGLGDSLCRLAAVLRYPALLQEQPVDQQRCLKRDGRLAFDELIDYIRANLDQPLRLSDLEARSHYSSRALHYAFRQRLGCTPRQWIRQQRLERAMEQLQQGDRRPSIRAIAWACGYRHMGLFSADFKRRFGCTPSQARR